MRTLQPLSYVLCCVLLVECIQPTSVLHAEGVLLLLDNDGGYSHAGRRVALRPDGSYTDTRYTDVVGHDQVKQGVYTLNDEESHLKLSPPGGVVEQLYRVDFDHHQYWVHEQELHRIAEPNEVRLRQISLRAKVP
jgi:hypothetical protein